MFKAGQKIGSYTLIEKLGRGGFGEVWLADSYGKYVTTQVAVKLPLDEQVDHALIEQEAQLWARARHTNVLPIIEANEYDGQIVIVSEYAPDGSLEQLLKNNGGKLPIKQAVEMTIGILNGLEFLHSRNIIHRDLKPANVLLQGETPRLADFGISRAMRTTMASRSKHISGTFAYMSPEALDGKRSVQTDIWSVSVNLYQLLTGKLPFPQTEFTQLLTAIAAREPEPLPDFVSLELKRIIAKSLEKFPENRYKIANEMREDLHRFLQGNYEKTLQGLSHKIPPTEPYPKIVEPVPIYSNSTITDISVPIETNETETFVHSSKPTKSKENSFLLISLLLGGLLIGGIGTFFITSNFFGNNSELTSSKNINSENSSKIENSSNNSANLDSANNKNLSDSANDSNKVKNSNLKNESEDNTNAESTPVSTPTPTPTVNLDGTWDVNYSFKDPTNPNFKGRTKFKIKKSGETLFVQSQNIQGEFYSEPNGKLKGNKVTIYLEEKGERVTYIGTIIGNTMKGSIKGYYLGTWSARKL